jgi:aldehyde dehydrogenase (NAD+)
MVIQFVKGHSDETLEVKNPATGETLSHITKANEKDVDLLVFHHYALSQILRL